MSLIAWELAFGYSGRPVGAGVSITISPGQTVAILGPNGGGKTTLLKTLLGLLPALGGAIQLEGESLHRIGVGERARLLGYVPQASAGTFAYSVRELVLMGRTAHQGLFASPSASDHEVVERVLGEVGIVHLAERPCTMVSGGERQLALIARALAQEPRYVILDEPTASLDFGNQGKVMRGIGELAGRGLGVLFTTHDPNHALRHADTVLLLGEGRLIACGAPGQELTREALENLYRAPVRAIGAGSELAFQPG